MLDDLQQERFTRLWTDAQPAVAGYVHAIVRDAAAAKDLVQDTALALLRRFAKYDEQRAFLPWALGVAKYEILSHRRDAARDLVTCDDELLAAITCTWAEVEQTMTDETEALRACLEKLAPHSRQVVHLRYYDELDATQIAQRFESNAGSVRVLLQRVRDQLRECMERQLRMEGGMA